jgi:alkylation response protein AidB-like acyl-CoA dehydrogenase
MLTRILRSSVPRLARHGVRPFSSTLPTRGVQEITREAIDTPLSLWNWTEEENMLRETVRRFAEDVVAPKARDMDENEVMDPVSVRCKSAHGAGNHQGLV